MGEVGFWSEHAVDLQTEDVAGFHHQGQQETDDDVENHQAEKHTR